MPRSPHNFVVIVLVFLVVVTVWTSWLHKLSLTHRSSYKTKSILLSRQNVKNRRHYHSKIVADQL